MIKAQDEHQDELQRSEFAGSRQPWAVFIISLTRQGESRAAELQQHSATAATPNWELY